MVARNSLGILQQFNSEMEQHFRWLHGLAGIRQREQQYHGDEGDDRGVFRANFFEDSD
jgi:hypothetical protein